MSYILLSYRPKSKTFLPIVESLFAQGRKGIRLRSKALWHYSLAIEAWQLSLYNTLPVLGLLFSVKATVTGEGTFTLWVHPLIVL